MSFPATFNIRYYQADLYQFVVRPKTAAGDPFPISDTTHNAFFYISTERGGVSQNTKVASADIVGGNIVCTIIPTLGNTLLSGTTYFYDVSVQRIDDAEEIYTLLTGNINVTADITEPA
jgi:hypothetical protein